jgi:hypothetical protein
MPSRAVIMAMLFSGLANCAEPEFSLSLSVPQDVLKAGSAVTVKIVLTNTTDHEIRNLVIPVAGDDVGDTVMFKASVVDGHGDPAPFTVRGAKSWKDEGADTSVTFVETVAPGKDCKLGRGYSPNRQPATCRPFCSATELDAANRDGRDCGLARAELIVSRLYDLSKPGKYTIQVTRRDDASKTIVKSNPITVTITP